MCGSEERYARALRELGEWLRDNLQALGAVYVKIGQIMSTTQSGVLPSEIVAALEDLQDKAQGQPFSEVRHTVRLPSNVVHVDDAPIAAASIGIVYQGRWRAGEGDNTRAVAIKVIRPTVRESLCVSLWRLARVTRVMVRFYPAQQATYLMSIVRTYRKAIYRELNYVLEAKNMERLAANMRPLSGWNVVPRVLAASKDYIVMEYVPGIKITDVDAMTRLSLNRPNVAQNLLEAYMYQCMVTSTFHSDPHPGNISIAVSGDRRPRFIWYDGGSIVQSNPRWREDLLQLSLSVIRSDVPSIVRNLEEMGIVQKGVVRYRRAVTRLIRMVLEEQKAMMSNENVMAAIVESIDRDAVWKADLRESFASESPYVILGKSILVLSQICIKLDPTFNLVQAAMPIVRKYWGAGGASDAGGFDQLWNELSVMVEGFSTMPTRVQSLQQQVYEMNDQLNAGDVSSRTGAAASPTRARIESAVIASVVVTLIQHLLL